MSPSSSSPAVHPGTILIVDDTPASLRLVAEHLESSGFRVMVAEEGEEAIDRAQLVAPDLILLDIMMPGLDGITVCRRLKQDTVTASIPVVFLTSLTQSETIVSGFAAGAVDYLTKPVQLDEMLARVRTHIALRRLQDDLETRVTERTRELAETNRRLLSEAAERERAEAQLRQAQKMDAFGQLAGGVAHDFNNIMSVVLGQAELALIPSVSTAEVRVALGEIRDAALRARNLTKQLLVFSRRQKLLFEPVDLNAVVAEIAGLLRRLIGENIVLDLALAPDPVPVFGDPGMLGQVIVNMAVNARDAMPGGGRFSISTSRVSVDSTTAVHGTGAAPGEYVVLTLGDSGTGISHEVLPRIFEPFFTTKDVGKGTGLGLATSLSIVQQHRGWIDVDAPPGAGARFRVYLPVREAAVPALAADKPAGSDAPRPKATILLVEDESSVRRVASRSLERLGYAVIEASDGEEAIEQWNVRRAEVDLVLTDIVMPGRISGRALARRLREETPGVRIALMTGYDPEVLAQKLSEQDRDLPHIQKPFTIASLSEFIRRVLER